MVPRHAYIMKGEFNLNHSFLSVFPKIMIASDEDSEEASKYSFRPRYSLIPLIIGLLIGVFWVRWTPSAGRHVGP